MTIAIIGFYSAMTLFFVPHMALGAELSTDYHERSRLFGVRHIFYILGSILSLGAMYLLINEEFSPDGNVRLLARDLAFVAIAIMVVLVIYAVVVLRERPEFQNRQQGGPLQAFRDIWGNPHARLLITVTFIENVGSAAIAALTLYISQYVVGAPAMAPLIILAYMIPSSLFVPMWIPLSKRYGKIKVWMAGMVMTGVSFGGMFVLPFLDTLDERLMVIIVLAFFAGLANGCGGTLGPSVQGDVIDFDEYQTGERKEGSYFAAWNFVYKSALGVMLLLTGFVLDFAGFVPNQEQTMQVKLAMVSLYGLFPLVCYTIGAILFSRFELDEEAYEVIRTELDARRAKEAASAQ
jgi:GPH family glycoside/pentoside/hexuronide:cation symporter